MLDLYKPRVLEDWNLKENLILTTYPNAFPWNTLQNAFGWLNLQPCYTTKTWWTNIETTFFVVMSSLLLTKPRSLLRSIIWNLWIFRFSSESELNVEFVLSKCWHYETDIRTNQQMWYMIREMRGLCIITWNNA